MSTEDRVIEVVAQTLEMSVGEVGEDDKFIDDLGATSLDIVNLIWRIEEEFALGETPEEKLEEIERVADLVELVRTMRPSEPSTATEVYDVALASDHAGVELKSRLVKWLGGAGYTHIDLGPTESRSVDYPDFAEVLGRKIAEGEATRGILVCGTGIGMSIAANKLDGIRAALVTDSLMAKMAREHNDANVLCMGSRIIGEQMAIACVESFLSTEFNPGDDGRHQRRVRRIAELERSS